jgi:predicted phage tail protein
MDQDQSPTGPALDADAERTPEQVREEIEQTRAELGDTVAALAEKTDVKAQAQHAADHAKETVSGKVSEIRETVSGKKDDFVSAAHEAAPESAGDAGQKAAAFARQNRVVLIALGAFAAGLLIGRARAR